jgi:plastocyanin
VVVDRFARRRAALVALILLPALSSCQHHSSDDPLQIGGPPPHDVDIVQNAPSAGANAFSPADAVISLATKNTVIWFNADITGSYGSGSGTTHHLKSDDGTTFDTGAMLPEGVYQATFSAPGTYTYHCAIHPSMTGTITVNP